MTSPWQIYYKHTIVNMFCSKWTFNCILPRRRMQYCSEKSNNSTVVYMYLWNQERKLRQISCIKETAKIHLKWHQRLEKFVSITSIYISGCCEIKQKQLNAVAGWWFKSGVKKSPCPMPAASNIWEYASPGLVRWSKIV